MNARGTSRSRSIDIITNIPETERVTRWLLEKPLTERRLALRLENTGKSPLLRRACLLSKFQTDSTYQLLHCYCARATSERIYTCAMACGCVYSTTDTRMLMLQLGCWTAASISITCICIHGYNQAWPHAPSYEVVGDYQNHVHVGDYHRLVISS